MEQEKEQKQEELQQEETVSEESSQTEATPEETAQESAPEETEETAEQTDGAEPSKDDKKKKKKERKDELAKKEAELAEQKDTYLRLMAEYQNYRNRTTEEKKRSYNDAKADAVKELLGVMDSFERAMEAPCSDDNYKKGIEMTFTQLQKAFEKLGVTEIAPLGEAFDPNLHNAIKQVDNSEYDSDVVCEVFQKGYQLGDRLIRPAMVAVAI